MGTVLFMFKAIIQEAAALAKAAYEAALIDVGITDRNESPSLLQRQLST
jgi:hypothetical protein